MVCGKKRLSTREKFKGDLYWHTIDTIGTIETHYNVLSFVSFLCCFCLHITEYEQIRGGGCKLSWAQGRKIPKYGPACSGHRPYSELLQCSQYSDYVTGWTARGSNPSRSERFVFSETSRQAHIQWVPGLFTWGWSGRCVKLTTHFRLAPNLRISGTLSPYLYAFLTSEDRAVIVRVIRNETFDMKGVSRRHCIIGLQHVSGH